MKLQWIVQKHYNYKEKMLMLFILEVNNLKQLANAYKNQGNYEEAIVDYSKALELNSKHAAAYYNRGLIFSDQQIYEKAIMDYSKAIELLPANPLYCFSLGFLYLSLKDLNQAYENSQKATQLSLKVTSQQILQFQITKDKIIFLLQKVEILTSIDKELQNVKEEMEYLLKINVLSEVYHQQYQSEIKIIEDLLGLFAPSKSKENQGEILQTLKLQMENILNCKIEISKLKSNLSQDQDDQNYHFNEKIPFNQTEKLSINLECSKQKESLNPKMNQYQHSLFWHLFNYLYIIELISLDSFMINSKFDSKQILEVIQQNDNLKNSNEGFVPIFSETFGLINRALDFFGNPQEKKLQSRVLNLKSILQAFTTDKSEYKREIEQASLYLMNNTKEDFEINQFNIFELFIEKISILEIDYVQYSESNFWKSGILHTLIILQYFDQNCQNIINQSTICTLKDIIVRSINEFNSESFAIEYIKQQ
ncbi:unnamed protein product (macronuclear) [Paramecium tetraurelia]|uniref:Uncharacterized protein n=1 Tax=Paramecium tetraurelia TaxID=5888 RepID=A0BWG3_PARTE|nr:uncharacterized protein GSPATT00032732001 [Paramecium tetraurelia]CAK62880.1 unnamed protein product [Paramecium tetraurelia]|eukprot:XP_001430278.1 hypothetical protein (macronuclear) [Paramecium tetraurelia strain d4-2]